jgi:hypothetical protein
MFGEVPLITTTDYLVNSVTSRSSVPSVYSLIIADLKSAQQLLPDDYSASMGEKTRPNKWAATALLARVYLYEGDWANAELQSSAIIDNPAYQLSVNLNEVFLSNSTEAIWQLLPVIPTYNTIEGNTFILSASPSICALSPALLGSFETGDQRKIDWIGRFTSGTNTWYFSYKYKIKTGAVLKEYSMVLRLAEQYLIRSEARTAQGNINNALADLNIIRNRAKLSNYAGNLDKSSVMNAIIHERQTELFTEWGHRWFDLKRTASIDSIMKIAAIAKGITWNPDAQLYPIPQSELSNNSNLKQNPGY